MDKKILYQIKYDYYYKKNNHYKIKKYYNKLNNLIGGKAPIITIKLIDPENRTVHDAELLKQTPHTKTTFAKFHMTQFPMIKLTWLTYLDKQTYLRNKQIALNFRIVGLLDEMNGTLTKSDETKINIIVFSQEPTIINSSTNNDLYAYLLPYCNATEFKFELNGDSIVSIYGDGKIIGKLICIDDKLKIYRFIIFVNYKLIDYDDTKMTLYIEDMGIPLNECLSKIPISSYTQLLALKKNLDDFKIYNVNLEFENIMYNLETNQFSIIDFSGVELGNIYKFPHSWMQFGNPHYFNLNLQLLQLVKNVRLDHVYEYYDGIKVSKKISELLDKIKKYYDRPLPSRFHLQKYNDNDPKVQKEILAHINQIFTSLQDILTTTYKKDLPFSQNGFQVWSLDKFFYYKLELLDKKHPAIIINNKQFLLKYLLIPKPFPKRKNFYIRNDNEQNFTYNENGIRLTTFPKCKFITLFLEGYNKLLKNPTLRANEYELKNQSITLLVKTIEHKLLNNLEDSHELDVSYNSPITNVFRILNIKKITQRVIDKCNVILGPLEHEYGHSVVNKINDELFINFAFNGKYYVISMHNNNPTMLGSEFHYHASISTEFKGPLNKAKHTNIHLVIELNEARKIKIAIKKPTRELVEKDTESWWRGIETNSNPNSVVHQHKFDSINTTSLPVFMGQYLDSVYTDKLSLASRPVLSTSPTASASAPPTAPASPVPIPVALSTALPTALPTAPPTAPTASTALPTAPASAPAPKPQPTAPKTTSLEKLKQAQTRLQAHKPKRIVPLDSNWLRGQPILGGAPRTISSSRFIEFSEDPENKIIPNADLIKGLQTRLQNLEILRILIYIVFKRNLFDRIYDKYFKNTRIKLTDTNLDLLFEFSSDKYAEFKSEITGLLTGLEGLEGLKDNLIELL